MQITKMALITLLLLVSSFVESGELDDVRYMQTRWAEVNYHLEGKTRETAFQQLVEQAEQFKVTNPDSAPIWIWAGIIKSSYAGAKGGLGALSLAKSAKTDLEKAIELNPNALQGSAYTSLGALYYNVPGWPIGFGDNKKAKELLSRALELNPNGIDSNYFFASYLMSEKRYDEARKYFIKASRAPLRSGREVADSGRQNEIAEALSLIHDK